MCQLMFIAKNFFILNCFWLKENLVLVLIKAKKESKIICKQQILALLKYDIFFPTWIFFSELIEINILTLLRYNFTLLPVL